MILVIVSFLLSLTPLLSHPDINSTHRARHTDITLSPTCGWEKFIFGNTGDFSSTRLSISSPTPVQLRITDAYCLGDEFMVYDWGRKVGIVRAGRRLRRDADPELLCRRPVSDPEEAWDDERFASGKFILNPGKHRITIKSISSPIGAGYAFAKLVAINHHPAHPQKYTLISCSVPNSSAESTCIEHGLKLAAVTAETFEHVSRLVYKHVGAGGKAWIKSYNGDSYNDGCLVFSVAATLPSGNVNIGDCSQSLAVVCQRP